MATALDRVELSDLEVERIADRVAAILSARQRSAAAALMADIRDRGFETVMVEGIQSLKAEADPREDRAAAHPTPGFLAAGTSPRPDVGAPTGD